MQDADAAPKDPEPKASEPDVSAPRKVAEGFRRALEFVESREGHVTLGLLLPLVALAVNIHRVIAFTVDDSYISYRYARNLADGLGLVYNAGEHIEGYTNFLFTVLLAGGIKIGIDPDTLAKVIGCLSAVGAVVALYFLAARLRPYSLMPCVATWLYTSSIVAMGYSVFGLETGFFVFLLLAGTLQMFRETEKGEGFWGSALLFGIAGLTRPEAPMYIGIPMLLLGRRFFSKQNLLRGMLFAAPIAAHMLFRHSYYGTWLPNTFSAKTGDLNGQIAAGTAYARQYFDHVGPVLLMAFGGLGLGIVKKSRELLSIAIVTLAALGYVILVGGDWMPFFRFMAPFEAFCFLLIDAPVRAVVDQKERAPVLAMALFGAIVVAQRAQSFSEGRNKIIKDDKVFWDSAAGGVAKWFAENNAPPGPIAVADIGEIGYKTNFPVIDLLGLVDPVISKLPGGYTHKTGAGYVDRVFDAKPRYFVLVGAQNDCKKLPFAAQLRLIRDERFQGNFVTAAKIKHAKNGVWCIFANNDTGFPAVEAALPQAKPKLNTGLRVNPSAP